MKTNLTKMMSFVIVFCIAFSCFVAPASVNAVESTPAVTSEGSYVETAFGEGELLITTTFNGATYYLPATTTSSSPKAVQFTAASEIPAEHFWTVTVAETAGEYYIQNASGAYLYTTSSSNSGVRVGSTKGAWKYDEAANSFQYVSTSRYLGVYDSKDWRCYTTVNQANYKESSTSFKFYKVNAAAPTVTVSGDGYTTIGSALTLTAELANLQGTVSWASSNESVATVANGVVTPVAMGTATITATLNDVVGSKEIKVFPATEKLTIAEAIAVCELTGTVNAPYTYSVTGVISSIDTPYDSGYNNVTVTVTDGVSSIKAFRLTGGSELKVGDQITVEGTLVNYYGNTPEFIAGCTYELVEDAALNAVRNSLNRIQAYLELGYRYTATVKEVAAKTNVSDLLNRTLTGITGNSYSDWSGKSDASSAVYAGQSAGGNESIQLRSSGNNSGIVTTVSGGKATKIVVTWNSNTSAGRTLNVYGSNTAYTAPTDLYGDNAGTLIGTIVNGTSTTLEITGDYAYIGIRSASGALYLTDVEITWATEGNGSETVTETVFENSKFSFRCSVDNALAAIENVDSFGIRVQAGDKIVNYSSESKSWKDADGCFYVTINLGEDVINNTAMLGTEFTVSAYVEIDGVIITSEQTCANSIAGLVAGYYKLGEDVGHLFNHLCDLGVI